MSCNVSPIERENTDASSTSAHKRSLHIQSKNIQMAHIDTTPEPVRTNPSHENIYFSENLRWHLPRTTLLLCTETNISEATALVPLLAGQDV
jgi:hypothetical protein